MTYNGSNPNRERARKRRSAYAIFETNTIKEASEKCGVSERALYRWMAEDDLFREEFARIEAMATEAADSRLVFNQEKAIQVIEDMLEREDVSDSNRLRAAKMVLDYKKRHRIYHGDKIRRMIEREKDPINRYMDSLSDQELINEVKRLKNPATQT